MGFALAFRSSLTDHSSLPVFASIARKRLSLVAPMNTRPPAVTVGPALPTPPVFCLPGGSASFNPSGSSQAMFPLLALTANKRPQGGFWHGQLPSTLPLESLACALNPLYGPGPLIEPRSYGCGDPLPEP